MPLKPINTKDRLEAIKTDAQKAFHYCANVLNQRWPEAEPIIMKSPKFACLYAIYVLKERWPEAEPIIMKDPLSAYYYAAHVLKKRWPEAEPYIMKDPYYYNMYIDDL